MKTTNNILMKITQYIKTFTGIGLMTIIIGLFGVIFLYASTASVGPSGEDKNGKFYEYFSNITTSPDVSISNPYFTGFGTGFKSEYSDGDAFVKSYLATLGGSSTDIVTGFDGSGEIQRTSIEVFMKSWLGSFGINPIANSAIIGFSSTTGRPIYSREVGYWSSVSGGISYTGGVQIGESAVPGSLEVVGGNITVNNIMPSNDDDLVTKSYIDSYLRDTCVRFLGTWDASTSKCSKVSGGGGGGSSPTCSDGIKNQGETGLDCGGPNCGACSVTPPTPTCSDKIQNGGETGVDCGGPSCAACPVTPPTPTCSDGVKNGTETGIDCGGNCSACAVNPPTNSCNTTYPACNPAGCSVLIGSPSSVNQSWVKDAASCGYSCTNGYTGVKCEVSPILSCTGCNAPTAACNTTTNGVDSCGKSCSNVGDPCPTKTVKSPITINNPNLRIATWVSGYYNNGGWRKNVPLNTYGDSGLQWCKELGYTMTVSNNQNVYYGCGDERNIAWDGSSWLFIGGCYGYGSHYTSITCTDAKWEKTPTSEWEDTNQSCKYDKDKWGKKQQRSQSVSCRDISGDVVNDSGCYGTKPGPYETQCVGGIPE